ncbi:MULTISPECIES: hypothetical protein [unclassified Pseudomonas]|uniref:hypothetical protein n=1 Tax=unclassified Pseudomonas TaxID=196821 RepID=UPI00244A47C1|nr:MULTISPECIES: hypothetical protein [unclassified Pseudomonas]MDG9924424.1 hypothetical protein [Pseudomonas sp. GD04045]MDH0035236.1 hypothetical protein [Pseudomonas sp. GD04019]
MQSNSSPSMSLLLDEWRKAQREVELYIFENYPIDTPDKELALRQLALAAAEAEKAIRAYVRVSPSTCQR